jgi:hypothetical protein
MFPGCEDEDISVEACVGNEQLEHNRALVADVSMVLDEV